jgi:hypothetical protein
MKTSAISRRAAGLAMFVFAPLKLLSASARSVRNGSSFSYLIYVRATPVRVWSALLDPEMQKRIWLGHFLESKWQAGAPWQMVSLDGRLLIAAKSSRSIHRAAWCSPDCALASSCSRAAAMPRRRRV